MPGATLWLTGLPCSGKTTIARSVESALRDRNVRVEVLDGEKIRARLSPDLGFSRADRDAHIRRLAFMADRLSRNGVVAIVAAISPYRAARDEARQAIGDRFHEIYLRCPLAVCEQRDVKGLYRLARAGTLHAFTGIDDPYEAPLAPELTLDTDREGAAASTERMLELLHRRAIIMPL